MTNVWKCEPVVVLQIQASVVATGCQRLKNRKQLFEAACDVADPAKPCSDVKEGLHAKFATRNLHLSPLHDLWGEGDVKPASSCGCTLSPVTWPCNVRRGVCFEPFKSA